MTIRTMMAGAALLLLAAPAGAATVTATATVGGTIDGSLGAPFGDETGVFGTPGSNLDGVAFLATLVFDTALGNRVTSVANGDQLSISDTDPLIAASFTVNGVTVDFGSLPNSAAEVRADAFDPGVDELDNGYFTTTFGQLLVGDEFTYAGLSFAFRDDGVPGSLEQAFSLGAADEDGFGLWFGTFDFLDCRVDLSFFGCVETRESVRLVLNPDSLTVTVDGVPPPPPPSPVPLPASGALLLAGLGAAGLLRRRR